MRSMFWAVTLCCAVCGVSQAPAAIVNGDFETGDLTGWFPQTNGIADVVADSGDLELRLTIDPEVEYGELADIISEVSQTFTVTEPQWLSFELSYSLDAVASRQSRFSFSLLDMGTSQMVASSDFGRTSPGNATGGPSTVLFKIPAAGTYVATFGGYSLWTGGPTPPGSGDFDIRIDDVALTLVPEPTTWTLGLIGLAAIAGARRFRSR